MKSISATLTTGHLTGLIALTILTVMSVVSTGSAGDMPAKGAVTYGDTSKAAADFVKPMRNKANHIVTLETNFGKLTLELFHDLAPAHADSFYARVKDGFYAKQIFHRIIPGFMMQGGSPKGDGMSGAGYTLKAEFSKEPHVAGTLSMARTNDPNSASSQFFICFTDAAYLNGQYTVFGQLLHGYDVLYKIEKHVAPAGQDQAMLNKLSAEVKLLTSYPSDAMGKKK